MVDAIRAYSEASWIMSAVGGTYYATNGTTGKIDYSGTNINTVLQAVFDVNVPGDLVFFKPGIYGDASNYINVSVKQSGIRLVGSGRGAVANYGTYLIMATSGSIDFSNASGTRYFNVVEDMTLNGGNRVGARGITTDTQMADKKFCQMTIQRCDFTGFKGTGAMAIDIVNHERIHIDKCSFAGPGNGGVIIRLRSNDYYSGNCNITNNYFDADSGITNTSFIEIVTSDNKENDGYFISGNSGYNRDYPNYFVHLNAASGPIKYVKILHNRSEFNNLVKCSGSGAIQEIEIAGNNISSGTALDYDIEMTSQARAWNIHDNYFASVAGRTEIYDASTNTTYPSVIHDNIFFGGGTYYSPSGTPPTKVYRNIGYVTENSGTTTVANGGTIAHGLSKIPIKVRLVANGITPTQFAYTVNATNITVYHTSGGSPSVTWEAEA